LTFCCAVGVASAGNALTPADSDQEWTLSSDGERVAVPFPALRIPPPRDPRQAAAGRLFFSQDSNANGLYELDPQTGQATHLGQSGVTSLTVGLCPSDDPNVLYGSKWSTLLHIKADGSGFTDRGGVGTEGLAFDGETLYGAINGQFFTMDRNTGARLATLAAPGGDAEGLAYCPRGHVIYGLLTGGSLRKYDIATNTWSTVGSTGVSVDNHGLAYDAGAHVLYAKSQNDVNLYRVDPDDASTEVIGSTGITGGGGLAFVGGGATCVYTLKKSKSKRGCDTCPQVGSDFRTETACEDVQDCDKRLKTTIACPEGQGVCKLKGKRSSCG